MMYKEVNFLPQFDAPERNVNFKNSKRLSLSDRQEMILKIIETKQYIDKHKIKCDFEIYSDMTMYIGIADQELENLFAKLRSVIDSATLERLPVLLTQETVYVNEQTKEMLTEKEAEAMLGGRKGLSGSVNNVEMKSEELYLEAEIQMDLRGFSKEQMEKLVLMLNEEVAITQLSKNNISSEKQSQLDGVQLLNFDITRMLENNFEKE